MPWLKGTPAQQRACEKYYNKLSGVNQKAKVLHNNMIKKMAYHKRGKYYGLFFHVYLMEFCRRNDLKPILVILLIIIDFYEVFLYEQLQDWGLTESDEEITHWIRRLRREGYTDREKSRRAHYFLTLKSVNLLKNFNEFYEERWQEQTEKNRKGHKKLVVYLSRGDLNKLMEKNELQGIKVNRTSGW